MPVSADTLQALLAAGVEGVALIEIVRLIDRDMAAGQAAAQPAPVSAPMSTGLPPDTDPVAERRRAYDRDRKAAARRAQQDASTGHVHRTSTGLPPDFPPDNGTDGRVAPTCAPEEYSSLPSLRSEELIPLRLPSVASPKSSKRNAQRSTRCQPSWSPSDADREFATVEGFSPGEIERELAKFRDHEFAKPRSDWSATFRNWLRRAAEDRPRNERSDRNQPRSTREDRRGVWSEIAAEEHGEGLGLVGGTGRRGR